MVESIEPRRQQAIIDAVHWEADAEFGVFPQGARAKEAVFSPARGNDPCIVPKKRYLFKRSKRSYPDQFWGEVVAYRVGCCMGLAVPPAFGAYNSGTMHSAALIEWFYEEPERFVHAGDYLQRIIPNFDRTKGTQHNLADAQLLFRLFTSGKILQGNWRQWLADMFLFDAVIGNTDRHQDNWGIIFKPHPAEGETPARIAPLFDNGTSLGHERFVHRVAGWGDEDIDRYIARGCPHMGKTRADGSSSCSHDEMIGHVLNMWPDTCAILIQRLHLLEAGLPTLLDDIVAIEGPVKFTLERAQFINRLLSRRLTLLRALIS
jgi:hypothetical protein